MGRISKGILGGFSGTVGTVVGSTWRGIEYIRSKPSRRRSGNTETQKRQQVKFSLVMAFVQTMKDLIQIGYKVQAKRMTEQNSAVSNILKNAVSGEYPDYTLVYSQVPVSRGSLPNAMNPVAIAGAAGAVNFSWTDNTGIGKAKAGDHAMLVAYCEPLQRTVYIINPLRSAGEGVLAVPDFTGHPVQTWLSFVSEDGKDVATSVFTGVVNVA